MKCNLSFSAQHGISVFVSVPQTLVGYLPEIYTAWKIIGPIFFSYIKCSLFPGESWKLFKEAEKKINSIYKSVIWVPYFIDRSE